eukprot:527499-Hanusia_phi.AAC.1
MRVRGRGRGRRRRRRGRGRRSRRRGILTLRVFLMPWTETMAAATRKVTSEPSSARISAGHVSEQAEAR